MVIPRIRDNNSRDVNPITITPTTATTLLAVKNDFCLNDLDIKKNPNIRPIIHNIRKSLWTSPPTIVMRIIKRNINLLILNTPIPTSLIVDNAAHADTIAINAMGPYVCVNSCNPNTGMNNANASSAKSNVSPIANTKENNITRLNEIFIRLKNIIYRDIA